MRSSELPFCWYHFKRKSISSKNHGNSLNDLKSNDFLFQTMTQGREIYKLRPLLAYNVICWWYFGAI